jgi:hypothetical protein
MQTVIAAVIIAAATARLAWAPNAKPAGLATREPNTAIAIAPLICRKVLNTALAVPDRAAGALSRTTAVVVGIYFDPPGPIRPTRMATSAGDCRSAVAARPTRPTTMSDRPDTIGTRGPNRFTSDPLDALPRMLGIEEGRNASPATNGLARSAPSPPGWTSVRNRALVRVQIVSTPSRRVSVPAQAG